MEHFTAQDYLYISNRIALFDRPDIFGMVKSIRLATNLFRLSAWLAELPELEFVKVLPAYRRTFKKHNFIYKYVTISHFETAEEIANWTYPRSLM
jgi:hypothetical protein